MEATGCSRRLRSMTVSDGHPNSLVRRARRPYHEASQADSSSLAQADIHVPAVADGAGLIRCCHAPASAGHGPDAETLGALPAVEGPETQAGHTPAPKLLAPPPSLKPPPL